jgi:TPR repeat protein
MDALLNEFGELRQKLLTLHEEHKHAESLALIQPFADKGLPIAQHLLGTFYYYGRSVPRDLKEAIKWFQKAADQGYGESLSMLGYQYIYGQGVTKDIDKGVLFLEQAGQVGTSHAYFQLGQLFGSYSDEDSQLKAANYFIDGIKVDNKDCMRELAFMYGNKYIYKKALQLFEMAFKLGDMESTFRAAYMYQNGLGCDQDLELAFMMYQEASKCGSIDAFHNLGTMYYEGLHVEQDKQKAFECYLEAANKNNAASQFAIGFMYFLGDLPQDLDVALAWFKKSEENGNEKARTMIAEIEQIKNKNPRDIN